MKTNLYEIADFFKQLSLLTKSDLPIPATIKQLSRDFKNREMRKIVMKIGENTDNGKTLSESLAEYPKLFHPLYIRMIALGEKEGSLPNILAELSRLSRLQYMLAGMVRDILLYPLITISLALLIFLFLGAEVIPQFKNIFDELLCGEPLPGLTNMVIGISNIIKNNLTFFIGLYVVYLMFIIWILAGSRNATRTMLLFIRKLPFSEVVFYNFAMARLCNIWAMMMKRQVPAEEALPVIANIIDFPELKNAILRITEKCRNGGDMVEAMKDEPDISNLLIMTLENSAGKNLPEELEQLGELFQERGNFGFRKTGIAWEMMSVSGMITIAGIVIIILFLPLILSMFRGW